MVRRLGLLGLLRDGETRPATHSHMGLGAGVPDRDIHQVPARAERDIEIRPPSTPVCDRVVAGRTRLEPSGPPKTGDPLRQEAHDRVMACRDGR